jgi:hypothetical protein
LVAAVVIDDDDGGDDGNDDDVAERHNDDVMSQLHIASVTFILTLTARSVSPCVLHGVAISIFVSTFGLPNYCIRLVLSFAST